MSESRLVLKDIKKILIIDLAFIGDVLLATPVTRALKKAYPDAAITMMTIPLTKSMAEMNPYVDDVIVYDKRGKDDGLTGMWRVAQRLKPMQFDLAICMNFAVRGAVTAWLAGIPHRLGYDAQHAGFFLTMSQSPIRDSIKHETQNHLEVLRPLGIDDSTADTSLTLDIPESANETLKEKSKKHHIPDSGYLVLCPIGSYERKNIFQATAAHILHHYSVRRAIFLIGGKADEHRLSEIAKLARLPSNNVLAGTLNLKELAAFLKNADCLITCDTGPMHIAQAVGCRTIALFGPTDPKVWGPRGEHDVILTTPFDCSPCWGKGKCSHAFACVGSTTATEIIKAVDNKGQAIHG